MDQVTVSRELLRQAIDALRACVPDRKYDDDYLEREYKELNDLRNTLRTALEQPEQQLVPRMSQPNREVAYSACATLREIGYVWDEKQRNWAAPQAQQTRKAVKLTKEQLLDIFAGEKPTLRDVTLCRAIEQAVLKKNGMTE